MIKWYDISCATLYYIHALLHYKLRVKLPCGCATFYLVFYAQLFLHSQLAPHRKQSTYVIERNAGENESRIVAHPLT